MAFKRGLKWPAEVGLDRALKFVDERKCISAAATNHISYFGYKE